MKKRFICTQFRILIVLILLCLFGGFSLYASEIKFKKITQISDAIKTLTRDAKGYMWFGTESHLLRYDGYQLTPLDIVFPKTKNFTINNITKVIFRNDSLFVGTQEEGLFKINDNKVINYRTNRNSALNAISSNFITAFEEDVKAGLWIGTNEGLSQLSTTSEILNHPFNPSINKKEKYITSLLNLNDTELLVGTKAGAYIFNKISKKYIKLKFGGNESKFAVNAIHRDFLNNIWISSHQGIYLKRESEKKFSPFRSDIFNQVVTSIASTSNTIWVATFHNGLYKIITNTNTIEKYSHDRYNLNSLSANTIRNLYLDTSNILWINTTTGGLNYFNTDVTAFGLYNNSKTSIYCASQNNFLDFEHDLDQNLWLATNKELIQFNEKQKTCTSYKTDISADNKIKANTLFSFEISQYQPEIIWLSTYYGLLAFNKLSKKIDYSHLESLEKGIYFTYEYDEILVLGTNSGLVLYNYITKNKLKVNTENERLKNASIYSHTITNKGLILLATSEGLAIFDKFKKQLYFYKKINDKVNNIKITTLFIDKSQNLWIGTQLNGLFRFDSYGNLIRKYYYLSSQITMTRVYSLEENNGILWIGSNYGLINLNIQSNEFHIFNEDDGVQGNYFFPEASYKSTNGQLFFGGKNGFNSFYPSSVTNISLKVHPIILTNLYRFGKTISPSNPDNDFTIKKKLDDLDVLELGHEDYIISLEFASLDFIKSKTIKYAYFLEGFEPTWNYVDSNNRRITYTSLPVGEYKFRVKYFYGNSWVERSKQLRIISSPPIWLTWQAYVIYILFIVLTLLGYVKYKINNKIKINLQLNKKVKERTKELFIAKQEIETLLHRNNQFFDNISHEFKTPLTLILGPIKKLHETTTSPKQHSIINIIQNNANRLLTMVEHILQITKYNNHKNKRKIVIKSQLALRSIFESFSFLAEKNKISFTMLNNDVSSIELFQDTLEIILGNLISNAMKYTPLGGKVTISSTVEQSKLSIIITDTGCGLTLQQQSSIFKRFKRLDSHAAINGTGLGLSVVKELTELNNIQLIINSEIGEGSSFTLKIPTIKENNNSKKFNPNLSSISHLTKFIPLENTIINKQNSYMVKRKKTILIIEDNREMSQYISEILKPHYNYIIANDGREGVKLALKEIPNAIISDIMMPILNGYQVSHILRSDKLTSHIPIILLSALNDKQSKIKGWQKHIDLYLSKPFNSDELLSQLNSILVIRDVLKEQTRKAIESLTLHPNSNLPKTEQEFIANLFQIIKENYENPNFLRSSLASKMFLSERQLQRKTTSLINDSPMTLLRNYRLERAKLSLENGYRVNLTADKCGFNSVTYFSKKFKDMYGITPSEYKKNTLNKE